VNCEEIEKDSPGNVSQPATAPPQEHFLTASTNTPPGTEINYQHVESILLTKLQGAVSVLQETSSTDITIHQCQVIKACSEALLAIRKLTNAPTQ